MPDISALAGGTPYGAIAQGVSGLISGVTGLIQKGQGKKMLKGLQYPTESLPKEVTENQQLAKQQAATGMPSEQYSQAMKNIQRQQLLAIRGAQDRRAGAGLIPYIQQSTNDANLNVDATNSQMKLANERNYMNVNNQVANWKSQLFDRNVRDKYNRDYDYAMNLLGSGNQNLTGGIDKVASGALGLFGGGYGGRFGQRRSGNGYQMTESDFQRD